MKLTAVRIVLGMALLGVLVPFAVVGLYNLRPAQTWHTTVVQRFSGDLMPVLYPGSALLGAMIGVEENEPGHRYRREFVKWTSLSLLANAVLYAIIGWLIAGVRVLVVRRKPMTL